MAIQVVRIINHSLKLIDSMQHPGGLFSASYKEVRTGYHLAWIRDNIYIALGLEAAGKMAAVKRTYHALLGILKKHEYKIDWMIRDPHPKQAWRYIHARYDPLTLAEEPDTWGNKQNDAVGALLFKIGQLERNGIKIIRNKSDASILQKLVHYLESIEYWQDADNGMWEENEEVHASSLGACVAGLTSISHVVDVDKKPIAKGTAALKALLPRESDSKQVDLAQLSLIYPYDVVTAAQRNAILRNVEKHLVRERGLVRYQNDQYYHNGSEAEWTMGLCWLAIIYKKMNKPDRYAHYMRKITEAMNERGELPELYYGGTRTHNENSPLGWSQAMYVVAASV